MLPAKKTKKLGEKKPNFQKQLGGLTLAEGYGIVHWMFINLIIDFHEPPM